MKNILWVILLVGFVNVTLSAQDDGEKLAKKAKKAITNYYLDPTSKANLTEAKDLIDKAFATGAIDGDGTAWATKGEIYSQLVANDEALRSIKSDSELKYLDAALISFEAYTKSIEKSIKESAKKDSYKGITDLLPLLNFTGIEYLRTKQYNLAYNDLNAMLIGHEILKANKMKSPLDDKVALSNHYHTLGLAAYYDGKQDLAVTLFQKAFDEGNTSPEVYEGLINVYSESNKELALKYILEGRQKYPDNNNILFSEINYYLKENKLDTLINRLQVAKEREPENISIINTLGNTYEKLYSKMLEINDTTNSKMYFDKAVEYYNLALKKDPSNAFANYSLGAFYYNRAAEFLKLSNALADDLTKEGNRKYEFYQNKTKEIFDQALPYFLKAEESDPTDKNTLIALREIYARTNKLDKAEEYRKKIEAK